MNKNKAAIASLLKPVVEVDWMCPCHYPTSQPPPSPFPSILLTLIFTHLCSSKDMSRGETSNWVPLHRHFNRIVYLLVNFFKGVLLLLLLLFLFLFRLVLNPPSQAGRPLMIPCSFLPSHNRSTKAKDYVKPSAASWKEKKFVFLCTAARPSACRSSAATRRVSSVALSYLCEYTL
ncbi:hypothetical protein BC939DRAFT_462833 [Gamsiella multidivaricata]|uniref:uncharacterized protein n=1 Tax=Gamsiella multidivaricata TaxID=101098 RepID=UPI002220998F|nr:uncharacterized protein BC939DRAFT_462833 [Gamsiella multidivaricata]KAI7818442.1 hypothetical protein BC939DRAFT_462833 [Gamsiella multidivaricata]